MPSEKKYVLLQVRQVTVCHVCWLEHAFLILACVPFPRGFRR